MVYRHLKILFFLFLSTFFLAACSDFQAIFSKNKRPARVAKKKPRAKKSPTTVSQNKKSPPKGQSDFVWPLKAPVSSYYGNRSGDFHDGIDIDGQKGDPIVASASGEVVYEGSLGGYGKLIVVKHSSGLFTAYAHNKKNLVTEKQKVKQGQKIALVGATGNAQGDHLHFEVRDEKGTYDPMDYLPKLGRWAAKKSD